MKWCVLLAVWLWQVMALPLYRLDAPFFETVLPGLDLDVLRFMAVAPHFVLLVVFYYALELGGYRALGLALVGGLLVEAASLDPWGSHTMGAIVGCLLLQLPARERWGEHPFLRLPFLAVALAAAALIRAAFLWLESVSGSGSTFIDIGGSVLYSTVISLPLYGFLNAVHGAWLPRSVPLRV